jgi:hypothetical protein
MYGPIPRVTKMTADWEGTSMLRGECLVLPSRSEAQLYLKESFRPEKGRPMGRLKEK